MSRFLVFGLTFKLGRILWITAGVFLHVALKLPRSFFMQQQDINLESVSKLFLEYRVFLVVLCSKNCYFGIASIGNTYSCERLPNSKSYSGSWFCNSFVPLNWVYGTYSNLYTLYDDGSTSTFIPSLHVCTIWSCVSTWTSFIELYTRGPDRIGTLLLEEIGPEICSAPWQLINLFQVEQFHRVLRWQELPQYYYNTVQEQGRKNLYIESSRNKFYIKY